MELLLSKKKCLELLINTYHYLTQPVTTLNFNIELKQQQYENPKN